MNKLATLTLAAVLAMSGAAMAQTTWYVDDSCPGPDYVGTLSDPFCSIQSGINAAADGDKVLVFAGTYNEMIDLLGRAVTLRAVDGPHVTTIDGAGFNDSVVKCVSGEAETTRIIGFTFTNGNPGLYGGGMYCNGSSPTVINCIFRDNSAGHGGGMTNENCSPAALVVNCLFVGNTVAGHGGGMCNVNSDPTLNNCTFTGNTSTTQGDGGMINHNSDPTLTNCILWGDLWNGSPAPGEIHNPDALSEPIVSYSCIQGGYPGVGNVDCDPLLDGAGRLQLGSCAIDAGDTHAVPAGLFVDLGGFARVVDDLCTPDTGIPATFVPVTVDMGAYEYRLSGDFDVDDDIDLSDLAELLANYGISCY